MRRSSQCRMARAAVRISQESLAGLAGITTLTLASFENGQQHLLHRNHRAALARICRRRVRQRRQGVVNTPQRCRRGLSMEYVVAGLALLVLGLVFVILRLAQRLVMPENRVQRRGKANP